MTFRLPRLADVQCSRLRFEPGDRILVRTKHVLTKDEVKKTQKAVQQWAGKDVEVLVINTDRLEIEIERSTKERGRLHLPRLPENNQ